jgi:nitrate reductase NapE component
MDSQRWRERLIEQLRQQRLPPSYIGRLVEELTDHAVDLREENASMDAQEALGCLGTTSDLAATAGREFRRRTFGGRHPWITFVFGPVAVVPVLFVSLIAGPCGVMWLIDIIAEQIWGTWPEAPLTASEVEIEKWCMECFDAYVRFAPFAIAALLYCRWARRSESRRWGFVACAIVAAVAGFTVTKIIPSAGENPGMSIIGLNFSPTLRQLVQAIVPLAIAAWLLRRMPGANVCRVAIANG